MHDAHCRGDDVEFASSVIASTLACALASVAFWLRYRIKTHPITSTSSAVGMVLLCASIGPLMCLDPPACSQLSV